MDWYFVLACYKMGIILEGTLYLLRRAVPPA
jgi:hypothetical protein